MLLGTVFKDMEIDQMTEELAKKLWPRRVRIVERKYMDIKKPIVNKAFEKNLSLANWKPF